jgi:putative oxidoreductase
MWLFHTDGSIVPLILRITLAIVMFPHGAQKVLGWFGGHGLRGTLGFFKAQGVPLPLALLAIAAEFLGPFGLVLGLLTRVAAFGILGVMVVAILTVHRPFGFFMNWFGTQQGEGFEYHLLAAGIALALVVGGAGLWSIDALIAR